MATRSRVRSENGPEGGPSESISSRAGAFRDPNSLDAKLDAYDAYEGKAIAWCLLCNQPIVDEGDLISKELVIHNCRKGRALAALTGTKTTGATPPPKKPARPRKGK